MEPSGGRRYAAGVNLADRAIARLKTGGVAGLCRSVLGYTAAQYEHWRDASLDRKYGLETDGFHLDLAALGARGEHVGDSTAYSAIQIPVFHAMMRAAGVDPRRHAFVDFGCGKGRALILAAEHGFRQVLGVEFAHALWRLACANVDTYRRLRPGAPPIAVHFGDAVNYPIPREDAVLFFYNPFGERVMRKIAAGIEASLRAAPRSLVIAYRNPVHHAVFGAVRGLRETARNSTFAIYK